MPFGNLAKTYEKITKYPFGKAAFSYMFSFYAPYFLSIKPMVNDMKPGFGE